MTENFASLEIGRREALYLSLEQYGKHHEHVSYRKHPVALGLQQRRQDQRHRNGAAQTEVVYRSGVSPSLMRLTTNSLNSVVFSCFDIFIAFLSNLPSILYHPCRAIFQGKLETHAFPMLAVHP